MQKEQILKPFDLLERDNKFYYVFLIRKRQMLFDLDDLFR